MSLYYLTQGSIVVLRRDLKKLASHDYDLAVIGAGVSGASAAYDAARRGLKVCLLERGDFGGATSANSLKVIHGGFRYLQSFNFPRVRESIRERRAFLRIAPHLVTPLPCMVAAHDLNPMRSRPAFAVAAALYNLLSLDRNRGLKPDRLVPKARLLSRKKALEFFPAWGAKDCDGAALWYDALTSSTERLTLELVTAAVQSGAHVANYAEVYGLHRKDNRINGLQFRDRLSGEKHEIATKLILNAAGPWLDRFRPLEPGRGGRTMQAKAINLVINRRLSQVAVGLESSGRGASDDLFGQKRNLFLVPWGESTLAGTSYTLYQGDADQAAPGADELAALLDELNSACPGLDLKPGDVGFFHWGLLPLDHPDRPRGLSEQHRVLRHQAQGLHGLISLQGVKYTSGRALAQRAVDLAVEILDRDLPPSETNELLLPGAMEPDYGTPAGWSQEAWDRLRGIYGGLAGEVAAQAQAQNQEQARPDALLSPDCQVTEAEVLFAVRGEMACKLVDVVMRRTALGAAGKPEAGALARAGELAGRELGWNPEKIEDEIREVTNIFKPVDELRSRGG